MDIMYLTGIKLLHLCAGALGQGTEREKKKEFEKE